MLFLFLSGDIERSTSARWMVRLVGIVYSEVGFVAGLLTCNDVFFRMYDVSLSVIFLVWLLVEYMLEYVR